MNSSHICLACRRTLSRNRLHNVVQWYPRATFISLSDIQSTRTDAKSREDLLDLGNVDQERKKRYIGVRTIQERRKQIPRHPSPYNDGDQLEALFEESLKQPSQEPTDLSQPIASMEPYIHADALRKLLANKDCSVGDSWKFFVEHFGPEAHRKGSIDQRILPRNLHISENFLAKKLVAAKRKYPFSLDLPTVTEFSKVYCQLGVLRCQDWVEIMLVLLESLIKLDQSLPEASIHKKRLNSDVVGAWNVVFRQVGKGQDYPTEGSPYDWSHIPTVSANHTSHIYRKFGTRALFGQFTPLFPPRSQSNMAVVAITSFALLTRQSIADKAIAQDALPLISSLGIAIATHGFDAGSLASEANVPTSVNEFLKEAASQTTEVASNMQTARIEEESGSMSLSDPRSSPKFKSMIARSLSSSIRTDVASITKRLYDAMQRRDAPQVDKLWSDVLNFSVAKESPSAKADSVPEPLRKSASGTLTADLCNYFIMIYMALHQPSRAIEVWNHMVTNGLPPTLKTWDSMMNGCKACRDHKALEDVWMRMLQLGVQPDIVCWTTRISGLIECNKPDKGMYALDEMGRLWVAANKREAEEPVKKGSKKKMVSVVQPERMAVKPAIETINAAVAGLLRKHQTEAAHRVLAWAAKFDIKPNVITYNTLLTPFIRDGHSKEAMVLLKQMQKEGIEADVGTFTMILDEIFRYSDELTPEDQKAITDNIFSEMEAVGIKANIQTYGKMIYQLLQGTSGDLTTVNAVMEHMANQGIQPTTYIYTMLVTHYFAQEPADLGAVRNLIEHTRMEVGSVDHIFWDRVIEGYAKAGDTTSAMRVLGKLESGGGHPSWVTRQVLLSSLVQNDEWAIAKSIVNNVKDDIGGPKPAQEMKGKDGQQNFWRLAAELELL